MENSATIVYFGSLGNKVEGRYFCQKNNTAPTILILPPDPRYGGTMNNEIVKLLERVFQKCGFSTLAINYQGSGKSDGNFTRAADGIVTASIALDWLQLHNSESSYYWIVGYSFGAYVAADIATRRPEIENFVFLSPLIKQYDFEFMSPALSDGLIVVGEKDEFVNQQNLDKLLEKMNEYSKVTIDKIVIMDANHKYESKLEELEAELEQYINIKIATRITKPIKKKRRKRQKKENSVI